MSVSILTEEVVRLRITTGLSKPEQFLRWSTLLDGTERGGRIAKTGMTPLRFALSRYCLSLIQQDISGMRLYAEPYDEEVVIRGRALKNEDAGENFEYTIDYPDWLLTFFDDEDYFQLLVPGNPEKLAEVLQQVHEFVSERFPALLES